MRQHPSSLRILKFRRPAPSPAAVPPPDPRRRDSGALAEKIEAVFAQNPLAGSMIEDFVDSLLGASKHHGG